MQLEQMVMQLEQISILESVAYPFAFIDNKSIGLVGLIMVNLDCINK